MDFFQKFAYGNVDYINNLLWGRGRGEATQNNYIKLFEKYLFYVNKMYLLWSPWEWDDVIMDSIVQLLLWEYPYTIASKPLTQFKEFKEADL